MGLWYSAGSEMGGGSALVLGLFFHVESARRKLVGIVLVGGGGLKILVERGSLERPG